MLKRLSNNPSTITLLLLIAAISGCVELPRSIRASEAPNVPSSILTQRENCRERLNDIRNTARNNIVISDVLVLAGSATSASGGLVALLGPVEQKRAAGIIALLGAIIATSSQLVTNPANTLASYRKSERHWIAASQAIGTSTDAEHTNYTLQRFIQCAASEPSTDVPMLPVRTNSAPPPGTNSAPPPGTNSAPPPGTNSAPPPDTNPGIASHRAYGEPFLPNLNLPATQP